MMSAALRELRQCKAAVVPPAQCANVTGGQAVSESWKLDLHRVLLRQNLSKVEHTKCKQSCMRKMQDARQCTIK